MHRRQFLAAFATAPILAAACHVGDGYIAEDPPAEPGGPDAGGETEFLATNTDASGHSHSFTLQCAHAEADGWTYTAGGAHTHQVALTRDQLAAIFAGETVTVETTGGHPHTWVISRPGDECA